MDGQVQTVHPKKELEFRGFMELWTFSNEKVTIHSVNNPNYDGKYFPRFSWLKDSEIGELPKDWNYPGRLV